MQDVSSGFRKRVTIAQAAQIAHLVDVPVISTVASGEDRPLTGHGSHAGVIEDRFAALLEAPIWVCWASVDRSGRKVKLPINPATGKSASVANPDSWTCYSRAASARRKTGVGIVLSPVPSGRLVGFDLDTCRNAETGALEDWALAILETIPSYAEISPSGAGLKIFALMSDEEWSNTRPLLGPESERLSASWKAPGKDHPPGVEFYLGGRYFTVTGDAYGDRKLAHIRSHDVARVIGLCAERFARSPPVVRAQRRLRSGVQDLSESGRAFRACLAAVRAGVPMDSVPGWAARLAAESGRDELVISNAYWLRQRHEGTQLMRDYARAEVIVRREAGSQPRVQD